MQRAQGPRQACTSMGVLHETGRTRPSGPIGAPRCCRRSDRCKRTPVARSWQARRAGSFNQARQHRVSSSSVGSMAGELTQRRSTGGAVTRRRSSGARAAARACHRLEHMVVMFAFQKRRSAAIEAVQAPATAAAA